MNETTMPAMLLQVISTEDLAADVRQLVAEYHQATNEQWVARAALEATLSAEQRALYTAASDATSNGTSVWHQLVYAEMARHAPGLSTVIRLLWLHVIDEDLDAIGECCTPETGYDL